MLPAALREEQEKAFDRMQAGTAGHFMWLKRHRLSYSILGGVLVSLFMNASVFFASPWSIPIDMALGAAAAAILSWMRGGCWTGAGLFALATVISVILKLPFLNTSAYNYGGCLFTCFSVLLVVITGSVMGLVMDSAHLDHSVTS